MDGQTEKDVLIGVDILILFFLQCQHANQGLSHRTRFLKQVLCLFGVMGINIGSSDVAQVSFKLRMQPVCLEIAKSLCFCFPSSRTYAYHTWLSFCVLIQFILNFRNNVLVFCFLVYWHLPAVYYREDSMAFSFFQILVIATIERSKLHQ